MNFVIFAVAALLQGPVVAQSTPGATTVQPSVANAAAKPKADRKRYCLGGVPTGTRIPLEVCQTRAEWAAEGVNVDKPSKY